MPGSRVGTASIAGRVIELRPAGPGFPRGLPLVRSSCIFFARSTLGIARSTWHARAHVRRLGRQIRSL
jgi:hypothetical protein